MKKLVSLILSLVLTVSLLASCSSGGAMENFKEEMQESGSYQIKVTVYDMPFYGDLSITTMFDGNIKYTPASVAGAEKYVETVDGAEYTYSKNSSGAWEKSIAKAEGSSLGVGEKAMQNLFDPDKYDETDGGIYTQKKDVSFSGYSDVVMSFEGGICTIDLKIVSSGESYSAKIVISEVGKIELALPEVA